MNPDHSCLTHDTDVLCLFGVMHRASCPDVPAWSHLRFCHHDNSIVTHQLVLAKANCHPACGSICYKEAYIISKNFFQFSSSTIICFDWSLNILPTCIIMHNLKLCITVSCRVSVRNNKGAILKFQKQYWLDMQIQWMLYHRLQACCLGIIHALHKTQAIFVRSASFVDILRRWKGQSKGEEDGMGVHLGSCRVAHCDRYTEGTTSKWGQFYCEDWLDSIPESWVCCWHIRNQHPRYNQIRPNMFMRRRVWASKNIQHPYCREISMGVVRGREPTRRTMMTQFLRKE